MIIEKVVYNIDNGQPFLVSLNEEGESIYPDFEYTETPIPEGIYQPIYFDVENNKWIGSTREEYESSLEETHQSGVDKDKIISDLTIQLAAQQDDITNLKELTASLSLALAQIQGGISNEV
ncbi:tail fiber protein [Staphylococcus phage 37]|uniref:ORF029 n=1 Tax=Staphylococcus phage 37 TaxID=2936813 RepID=Q4ZCD2_9CAUD|nr:hypothetical protein [Staphylococcus simulans]YP_240094.1 tail fiber protein [Staphylococcus phage 37]AAX91290.1 ORF029 [Staphylococcus phage 37]MDQ7113893.1 hypothetical protein [Staphylococcus simulans]MDQ7117696.1 hypothetical protein [Staphylococcus simulans]